MFAGAIVWKGFLYSLLMISAKLCVSFAIYFEYFMGIWRTIIPAFHYRHGKDTHLRDSENTVSDIQMQSIQVPQSQVQNESARQKPPHSIALLVGFAMVARGEIGFLIASLAQSSGTLTYHLRNGRDNASSGEEIFLVITWAVVLCTITGPLGVGLIVRRLNQQTTQLKWLQQLSRQ
jgi:hypothetical protein